MVKKIIKIIISFDNLFKLPMYPGVPLVSEEFSGFHILAIPKSVMRK